MNPRGIFEQIQDGLELAFDRFNMAGPFRAKLTQGRKGLLERTTVTEGALEEYKRSIEPL